MIGRIFARLLVFGILAISICFGSVLKPSEADAKLFLKKSSQKLANLYDEVGRKALHDPKHYRQNEASYNYTLLFPVIVEDAKKFDYRNFKDQDLKYAFKELIRQADEFVLGEEFFFLLEESLSELNSLDKEKIIPEYRNPNKKLLNDVDLKKIMRTSSDLEELEYYWNAWREKTSKWAEQNFIITLEALNKTAGLLEMSPLEFWMKGYNITEMEKFIIDIQPLYSELHAFVRNLLQKKYGESIIGPDGLIPDHLMEQVMEQIWIEPSNQSIIEDIFPYAELPPLEDVLKKKFNATRLHQIAENFFVSLGFEKHPSSIWGDRIKMIKQENGDSADCHARFWLSSPNFIFEYCEKMNYWDFLMAFSSMGHFYHAQEMVGLPRYFYYFPRSLSQAIGDAAVLSANSLHHLKSIGMIDDFHVTQDTEMNRLMRWAVNQIWYAPSGYVDAKIMADLLSGTIKLGEFNSHYWNLMGKYAGVGKPKGYEPHAYDIDPQFFRDANYDEILVNIEALGLSYQIHKKLCELSGHFPKEPLHSCDISGSKKSGDILIKMMKLGTSKPFEEILAIMFPENQTISSEGMLEYFRPIHKWLVRKNKEDNVKAGWETPDCAKC